MNNAPVLCTPPPAGGIATIRLNRPDNLNSLDAQTKTELITALRAAATDPDVRAVVLTGTGKAICAGADLNEAQSALADTPLGEVVREYYNPIVRTIATMPKPVIAAINGTAAGAGLALAAACDFRIATKSATFTTAFARVGLSCDTGSSWTLPALIGRAAALDLLLRPRIVDAAEALSLGLVHRVVADDDFTAAVDTAASEFAAGPTLAYAAIKSSINFAASATFDEALEFEATQMTHTGMSADHKNAVESFLNKRRPDFLGR